MLLLRVTDDRGAVTQQLAKSFPFKIGRSVAADLRLEVPGVFDSHASITLGSGGKFIVTSEGAAILLLNGQPASNAPITVGDELTLGAGRILISLAPALQIRLESAEFFVWFLLVVIVLTEIAVIILAG